jgi:phosphodiesterase/alkaline phosphatase D-like protein
MTRDDCLNAIAAALNVRQVSASSASWQVIAESTPVREVILMASFVTENIDGNKMTPEALCDYIKNISSNQWQQNENGSLTLVLK